MLSIIVESFTRCVLSIKAPSITMLAYLTPTLSSATSVAGNSTTSMSPLSGLSVTMHAFNVADIYRTPVLILGDGMLGQIMEPIVLNKKPKVKLPPKDYVLDGAKGRPSRIIRSLILDTREMEAHNWKLKRKYDLMRKELPLWEEFMTDDAKLVVVAYGTAARIAKGAVKRSRKEGLAVGLLRPMTLWPFPDEAIKSVAKNARLFLVFEMNTGQMVDDVRLVLEDSSKCVFYGRPGGEVPSPMEISRIIGRYWVQKEL